jgi:hypothetical protein
MGGGIDFALIKDSCSLPGLPNPKISKQFASRSVLQSFVKKLIPLGGTQNA